MFNPFKPSYTTADKLLAFLIENDEGTTQDKFSKIRTEFPSLNNEKIISILEFLETQDVVTIQYADDTIFYFSVNGYSLAYLQDKYEKKWNERKWDLIKIGTGFILGLIAGINYGTILKALS